MISVCPVCESCAVELFLEVPQIPVILHQQCATRAEALGKKRGDLKLGFCYHCGHIYNTAFDSDLMDYSAVYDNSLYFSEVFKNWAQEFAQHLIQDQNLRNEDIIEVGCGKGDFLESICASGPNRGIGFDPSIQDTGWIDLGEGGGQMKLVRGQFSAQYKEIPGSAMLCRHVLEHIAAPFNFVKELRDSRTQLCRHRVYYEVPNVRYTLCELGIWDLIYEHVSYFSPSSLTFLLHRAGYGNIKCLEEFGNQFLSCQAVYSPVTVAEPCEKPDTTNLVEMVSSFKTRYADKIRHHKRQMREDRAHARKVVVWGAGSKGISFLNFLARDSTIEYIVDLNPSKHGTFVAGAAQEVVEPGFLQWYEPDRVIIMNPNYEAEITGALKSMGLDPKIESA